MTYQDLLDSVQKLFHQGLGDLPVKGWNSPPPRLPLNGLGPEYTLQDLLRALINAHPLQASSQVLTVGGHPLNLLAQGRDHVLLVHALPDRCPNCPSY